jgi:hypothetical protein
MLEKAEERHQNILGHLLFVSSKIAKVIFASFLII